MDRITIRKFLMPMFWEDVCRIVNIVQSEKMRKVESSSHGISFKVYEVPGEIIRIDIPRKDLI
jgi:hypothetical protein